MSFLSVAIFGVIGVSFRFWIDQMLATKTQYFWPSTLLINIIGSLAIGIFMELSQLKDPSALSLKTGLIVGLCGGFTTFSALSVHLLRFIEEGNVSGALIYGIGSLILGVAAVYLGMHLGRVL